MAKNANKKPKFKPIVFEIQKTRFNKALKNALSSISYCFNECSILSGIHFKINGEILTLASTDGSTLIKQELAVDEVITSGEYQLTLSGQHLSKATFKDSYNFGRKKSMSCLDKVRITINEESAVIKDLFNGIQYTIPALGGIFPEYEKLIPNLEKNKNYIKIGFNTRLMKRFADITHPRTGLAILGANKESPLAALIVSAKNESEGINTTAMLMPIQIRE